MKMENTPTLWTDRLILRRFCKEDAAALFELLRDEQVNRFLPWFPLQSLKEAETHLQSAYLDSYQSPRGYRYAVCLRQDNLPVGYVNVSDEESFDLGYGLRKEFWRQGIMTEAAKAVVERMKKDGVPYVTATHDVQNPASGAVMKNLGMTYRYSYEEFWKPKNIQVVFRLYQMQLDGGPDVTYQSYWDRSSNHFFEKGL